MVVASCRKEEEIFENEEPVDSRLVYIGEWAFQQVDCQYDINNATINYDTIDMPDGLIELGSSINTLSISYNDGVDYFEEVVENGEFINAPGHSLWMNPNRITDSTYHITISYSQGAWGYNFSQVEGIIK